MSLAPIEIDAVNSRIIHQYAFIPNSLRYFKPPEIVPKTVRAAASVVRSTLSQVAKKDCRKPKPGVAFERTSWIEVPEVPDASEVFASCGRKGVLAFDTRID